jgi:hypothetical protein
VPRVTGAASVALFTALTAAAYGLRLTATPLPFPIFPVLTIAFITCGSLFVSYIAAKAYVRQSLVGMLFLMAGALAFGCSSLLAALSAGRTGTNLATTIFIIGALVSSSSHLLCSVSRFMRRPGRSGARSVVVLTVAIVLSLVAIVSIAASDGLLPAFLAQGSGMTTAARALLLVTIAAFGVAALVVGATYRGSPVLYWYSCALAMTAVGLSGIYLSNWTFEDDVFWIGRVALCVGGLFLVLSVLSAERGTTKPDSAVEELFSPVNSEQAQSGRSSPRTERVPRRIE